jgi:hypothetical protein
MKFDEVWTKYFKINGKNCEWEECSVTCGGGNKTRNRTCTEPEPQYGGDNCTGHDTNYTSCNDYPCPSMYYSIDCNGHMQVINIK